MSTAIEPVLASNRWREGSIKFLQFSGGADKGKMIQVSKVNSDGVPGYIELDRDEAIRVAHRMMEWALGAAVSGPDMEE